MKTKMTKQEAQEFVKETKYIVFNEEESQRLQEKLFAIGCRWVDGTQKVTCTEYPFLYVSNKLEISYSEREEYEHFSEKPFIHKWAGDVMSIEITTEPKFDPTTLQPFDKVLARDSGDEEWRCDLFSHITKNSNYMFNNYMFHCVHSYYAYCIPYNDDTKHLLRTSDEAPAFYQID